MPQILALLIAASLIMADLHAAEPSSDETGRRFFTEKVEPLLKAKCLACHSHAGEMEGELTLDSRSGWLQGGSRGPAIVPGKPEESLLLKAVLRNDPDLEMPPDENERLSEAERGVLVEWIRRGAVDPRKKPVATDQDEALDWWSLRPLTPLDVPAISSQNSARPIANPIDAFIAERLQREQLAAAPDASRRALVRRIYIDLHGLPPTPDQVEQFVANPDPRAYEKLVDRLLASPRYGERWARHWLDTVHFADSHGCEHDVLRPSAWRYRDYVIDSLNRDTPWPRFIREQLAADRFYPDQPHLTAALGFIAAGPLELSRAGTAPVTFDYLDRDDMVTQTMAAFASTTANCARCHNHKFDPVSQEDYYSLQAVFAGIGKGDVSYDLDPQVAAERARWQEVLSWTPADDQRHLLSVDYADVVKRWEQSYGDAASTWEPLVATDVVSAEGSTLTQLDDGSVLASGARPDKDTYTVVAATSVAKLTALRLEVLPDDRLPMRGPGRQDNGNLHLNEFEAYVRSGKGGERSRLEIRSASADWDQAGWTISHALDGNEDSAWGIHPKVGEAHHAVFQLAQPRTLVAGDQLVIVLKQLHGKSHLIGRFKLYATAANNAASAKVAPDAVRSSLKVSPEKRTSSEQAAIAAFALKQHAAEQLALLPEPATVYAVSRDYSHGKKRDEPLTAPKVVHVLRRGNIDQPGKVAEPGALRAIAALQGRFAVDSNDEAGRRAALADWLADHDNPLTWRSIVNRIWAFHFGRGLSDTPNDFGRMGAAPSHPELLDWLAVWFRDDAHGSLKQLHRLIVLSAAYRRQSDVPDSQAASRAHSVDADNRLLWRMNRRRLDAESYRDAVLQISGRQDLAMGGPGIQHFTQSPGQQVTPKLHYDAFDWGRPEAARRSIYRVVWRGMADPFMETLDFPDLGQLSPKREFSVSALQALVNFNNDFVLLHSRQLAGRLQTNHPTLDEQVRQACRLIYLREIDTKERAMLLSYAKQHGLAALCRVLLNSNEFLFVE